MEEHAWWMEPLMIASFVLPPPEEIADFDAAELAETVHSLGFNAQHLGLSTLHYGRGGEKAYYYFRTEAARAVKRDFLREYLPEAHKRGIRVFIYFNVHWFDLEVAKEHPDWMQTAADGQMILADYGGGAYNCVNSPWREWSFQAIRDLAGYQIDGIFLDGPIFVQNGCYCVSCQEKFRRIYGMELSPPEEMSEEERRAFIDFRYRSIADYLREVREALKKERPEAVLYMNGSGIQPGRASARDNRRLVNYQDLLGAEGGYGASVDSPFWKAGATAKLLETQAQGKPVVIFITSTCSPRPRYFRTSTETKLRFADLVANGANPHYWAYLPNVDVKNPGVTAAAQMNRFIARHAAYFKGSVSAAEVALMWSSHTADFYNVDVEKTDFTREERVRRAGVAGNFTHAFRGYYEALVRSHIPFDVIDEEEVMAGGLNRYKALVLPNCACLPEQTVEAVREYVRAGGGLAATFETAFCNSVGVVREKPALDEVLGVQFEGGVIGPRRWDYVTGKERENPVIREIGQRLIPSCVYYRKASCTTGKSLAVFNEPLECIYTDEPPESSAPAVVTNEFGSGRCVYFSGNFDEHYWNRRTPEHRMMLAGAASYLCPAQVVLENAPQTLEVVLRRQPDEERILVHLINFTGEMQRPIEKVIPISDVKVRVFGEKARRVYSLTTQKDLEFEAKNEWMEFIIPEIEIYEVIVLEN